MNKSNNLILNAVLSKLQSEKDEVLAKIDLIVNKNAVTNVNSVVTDAVDLFKELNSLESTLELVKVVIDQNNASSQMKENLSEINNLVSKLNESQIKEQIKEQ